MLIIPLAATPSQTLTCLLGGQNCTINLYQKSTGVYLDLFIDETLIASCTVCRDRVAIVARPYLGFIGELMFYDLQGTSDPEYSGFGTRYVLTYAN